VLIIFIVVSEFNIILYIIKKLMSTIIS
jgi:hypothetical protein